jgi:hypothetical protein
MRWNSNPLRIRTSCSHAELRSFPLRLSIRNGWKPVVRSIILSGMDEPRRQVRYRGYRPPPLWWFKLKYLAGMAVFALFILFASGQVAYSILTGAVPVLPSKSNSIVFWSEAPWRFVAQILVWLFAGLLSSAGFCLLFNRLRGLDGPSAETRL